MEIGLQPLQKIKHVPKGKGSCISALEPLICILTSEGKARPLVETHGFASVKTQLYSKTKLVENTMVLLCQASR